MKFQTAFCYPNTTGIMKLPVNSTVAASRSSFPADRDNTITIPRPANARKTDQYKAYFIEGSSLKDAGILEGFIALVRTTFDADELKNGRLMSVYTQATGHVIKFLHFAPLKKEVRLVSANSCLPDMVFPEEEVTIEGIVESVINYVYPRI